MPPCGPEPKAHRLKRSSGTVTRQSVTAALASSTATWAGSPGGSAQKVLVTFTPQKKGPICRRVKLHIAITVYVYPCRTHEWGVRSAGWRRPRAQRGANRGCSAEYRDFRKWRCKCKRRRRDFPTRGDLSERGAGDVRYVTRLYPRLCFGVVMVTRGWPSMIHHCRLTL
jgi:hypothetical protein